nr:hypothetical protein GCM10020093_032480 [Planobispora longispora]
MSGPPHALPLDRPAASPATANRRNHVMNRIRTKLAAALVAAVGVIGLATTPAQAATEIVAELEIGFNTGVPAARTITLSVHVPMNEYDANGYLIHGGRIQVRFYGSDPGTDSVIYGPITWYRGTTA